MSKKTKTPEAPNYSALASQQAEMANKNWQTQLQANRPNQYNQFGSSTWEQDPATGQWTQRTQLNQPQQDIFNQQQANQQQIANMGGGMLGGFDTSQIDLSKAPGMPGVSDYGKLGAMPGPVDYSSLGAIPQVGQYSQQATDLYNKLAQPQLDRQRASKEAQMAAMGLSLGSGQAYNTQQELLNDSANRSAMMGAQAGIQQGNIMFGQGMQGYQQGAQNLNNQFQQGMAGRQQGVSELNNQFTQGMGLHQQGVQDILSQRQANLGQLSGLMGLGQQMGVPQFENFTGAGQLTTPDMMGAAQNQYGANLDKTNAANADKANTMKTVGTVASIAAAAF